MERNSLGFLQHYDNPLVDRIQYKFDGSCTVHFKDGSTKDHFIDCETVFNSQYGIPASKDGKLLFVGSWEKGLTAYDTVTGEKKWKYRPGSNRNIFVYSDFLVMCRGNRALVKLDLLTGEVLWEQKSGTLEHIYLLDERYFYADTLRGKPCVLDALTMETVKKYSDKQVNPRNCLSLVIRNAFLQDGRLLIEGFEGQIDRYYYDSYKSDFCREIDPDFYDGLIEKP